jgi:hypothetical protein
MIAVLDSCDDAIASARGEGELGEMRRETDDALRRRGVSRHRQQREEKSQAET